MNIVVPVVSLVVSSVCVVGIVIKFVAWLVPKFVRRSLVVRGTWHVVGKRYVTVGKRSFGYGTYK